MEAGPAFVRVGLLVTGDTAVRAAHSLQAHPSIDEIVVIGPATSKSFEVVDTAEGCDYLVGHGHSAPGLARKHGIPLIWDGEGPGEGIAAWGAAPTGVAIAMAARETDPQLVAVAHPEIDDSETTGTTRFPDPVGWDGFFDASVRGRPVALAHSPNDFAACLAVGASRRVTVVDHAAFLSGVALAAGLATVNGSGGPVWRDALPYLEATTEMGLVMAESE
ncbi:MAG TPA: hypothetical protein VK969_09280 [Acidimicrobiia bacterium]|nr:hypothetical protein [Acidimicrobiia bacterium]